ncbi:SCO7613 C-terminal domain-containing membrane protein [Streptomyces sp. NPDC060194]|uniref:SCO7613 C-terminal domain-containing membrane protein n=1 Tax=Streptomyces sp. NPDC060194 TaxID=3347069 RepID=UPI003665EAA5
MTQTPPPAEELRLIDAELWRLDARRAQLLTRRGQLLHLLHATPPAPRPVLAPRPSETSPRGARNVLLALGGALLTVAALAFTLLSWGDLGIGGRAAVLGTVTALVLTAPAAVLRRGLTATAESLAALGLALTVLDAYALHRAALPGVDGLAYAAVAAAVLAAGWGAYARLLPALRGPGPAAVVAAQFPLLLATAAAGARPATVAAALLVTAALDAAAVVALGPAGPTAGGPERAREEARGASATLRATAAVAGCIAGGLGLLVALELSLTAGTPLAAALPGCLLLFAAVTAAVVAHRLRLAWPAVIAGLSFVAAAGGVLRPGVPGAWAVPGYLLSGLALLAVLRSPLPRPVRGGLLTASALTQAAAALWAAPVVAGSLLGPLTGLEAVWSAPTGPVRDALDTDLPWSVLATAPLLLAALAIAARPTVAALAGGDDRSQAGNVIALTLAWATVLTLPYALALHLAPALVLFLALTAATAGTGVLLDRRSPATAPTTTLLTLAGLTASTAALASLGSRTASLTTLPVLPALAVATAVAVRPGVARQVAACAAVVTATGLAGAAGAGAGLAAHATGVVVLSVPAVVAVVAARLRTPLPAVELTAGAAGAVSIALASTHAPTLALVLALCGVLCAGTALRPDRRPVGYAAAVLFVLATWARLAASDVTVPEAYTLPVTVPALLVGRLRRRRDPAASSWPAYGPGLAATLLPSLLAVLGDAGWQRPLLLGLAALGLTLLGAHHRLQAPLVLGATALAAVALHELAPYLVQVVDAAPRWLPPALAGLLLLGVGATYERRLREARRIVASVGRMR